MQIMYATHLVLPGTPIESEPHLAEPIVADWITRRFGVQIGSDLNGKGESDRGRVTWSTMVGDSGRLLDVAIDQPDEADPRWRWRTFIDVGTEKDTAWVRVRLGLDSQVEGLITSPRVKAGRPGVVRDIVDHFPLMSDGWKVGEWRPVQLHQVDRYLGFLADPGRKLPVVTISEEAGGGTFLDPAHTADRLLGLAHVVAIDTAAAYAVSDRIGKTLSSYRGAVRIYWPGFTPTDDPYFHRLFVAGALTYLGRPGVEDELFTVFGRLAGLSLGEPALRRRLKSEARTEEIDARASERAEAMQRLNQAAASGSAYISAEEFADFAKEYELLEARYSEMELSVLDAEIEFEELRGQRDDARAQILDLVRAYGNAEGGPDSDTSPALPADPPTSVTDAVNRAATNSPDCVFLPEAFSSAAESQYPDPQRVSDDLALIQEIAHDWAHAELPSGPNEAFRSRCSGYRDGISQLAETRYATDYVRDYDGSTILLGPHVARGIGAVASILRIYMYFDTDKRKIVIGHVGRKLRDASNRN